MRSNNLKTWFLLMAAVIALTACAKLDTPQLPPSVAPQGDGWKSY